MELYQFSNLAFKIFSCYNQIPLINKDSNREENLAPLFSIPPSQGAVESNEVMSQLPFLQIRQACCSLDVPSSQPFFQLWRPPLDAFKDLQILLKLWGPELHTVLKVRTVDSMLILSFDLLVVLFDTSQDSLPIPGLASSHC